MTEDYTPPEIPSFPTDVDTVLKSLAPYLHDGEPAIFFFEMYVCDVIQELPKDTESALEEFSNQHPSFFEKHKGQWRQFVKEAFNLSENIETAIWDLWIRNSQVAKRDGWVFEPWHYAMNFVENYFADGSQIDVWEDDALELAKKRVEEYRNAR